MSYINYTSEENAIYVCKGHSKSFTKLISVEKGKHYDELRNKEWFSGVKINNFLSDRELDGLKGEEKFKALLDANNIPYLYIGQGPFGIERSGVLLEQTKAKRADFIVTIPNMGTLLFDIKCRTRLSFKKSGERYFCLYVSELEALYNLQKIILMPVWLAFYDREHINESDHASYFIPITLINTFYEGIQQYFEENNKGEKIHALRIPNELFTEVKEQMSFEVGYTSISKEIIEDFAIKNIGFNRKLRDKIKNTIRENGCYKSYVRDLVLKHAETYLIPDEVSICIHDMINNGTIAYEARKKLSLFGE